MTNYIGIDLGTTNSAVSKLDETGRPVIVHNPEGSNITPSVISFSSTKKYDVGEVARKSLGEPNTFGRFKRDMGGKFEFEAFGIKHTPESLSALLLKKLKEDTENTIGNIEEAVVTIPANFANEAREATLNAARKAGLNVKNIINEPTAAALYYAFHSGRELDGTYAVYDLGGGTFDVSIISVHGKNVKVLATEGVSKLGGDDFDKVLQKIVSTKYKKEIGSDLDPEDYNLIDAEDDKKSLSRREVIKVSLRSAGGRASFEVHQKDFEEAISSFIAQTEMLCETAIDDADLVPSDISEVFLVGGSSRIPCIQKSVERVFKRTPVSFANPDEVVALGAALYAAYKSDGKFLNSIQKQSVEKISVAEITSKFFGTISVGMSTRDELARGNSIIIEKGEKIPCTKEESFFTMAEGQTGVNCVVTESNTNETDPKFVKIIWEGDLELPAGRSSNQEIIVRFSYDQNQVMKCSFIDVETDKKTEVDLSMGKSKGSADVDIDKFMVE
ncbi:MAG: Hsp70 family protein [Alphaproteobacteria bacterium]|nr:Hsp70 family protein [Alphaproteobacteria bacterium]